VGIAPSLRKKCNSQGFTILYLTHDQLQKLHQLLDESWNKSRQTPILNTHIFMGCRIFGFIETTPSQGVQTLRRQPEPIYHLREMSDPGSEGVCLAGECVNCTDTDLFCLEECIEREPKFCTHFVRLNNEGFISSTRVRF